MNRSVSVLLGCLVMASPGCSDDAGPRGGGAVHVEDLPGEPVGDVDPSDSAQPLEEAVDQSAEPDAGSPSTIAGVGEIEVVEVRRSGTPKKVRSRVSARFVDEARQLLVPVRTVGSCTLAVRTPELCDPPCDHGSSCMPSSTGETPACLPWLDPLRAGEGSIAGLKGVEEPLPLTFQDYNGAYVAPALLPPDIFDSNTVVLAQFAGGEVPPLEVEALGVDDLDVDWGGARREGVEGLVIDLSDEHDLVASWSPGRKKDVVQIRISSNNQFHGAPPDAELTCRVQDTGELRVPKELMPDLPTIETGVFGADVIASSIERRSCSTTSHGTWKTTMCTVSRVEFVASFEP
jgi:hypothetical protein